jgi:hypothetical protein
VRFLPNFSILVFGIEILSPEARMQSTIPAELLELKTRFDHWRANRKYNREPIPDDLRQAAIEITRRHPSALVRRLLKLDPWRLQRRAAKPAAPADAPKKPQPAFFHFPANAPLPDPLSPPHTATGCQLQLERSDGARLTLTLPALDLISINRLCADFLRGSTP